MKGNDNESLQVRPLEGEEVQVVLGGKQGLAKSPPPSEDYVLLTSQRVIATWRDESKRRQVAMPLQRVDGLELTELSRETKPLFTGGLFMAVGVAVPVVAALLELNGVVAWILAFVLVVLGAVTASAYFVRDQAAVITFRAGATEASLPLRTAEAVRGAYAVARQFFALTGTPPAAGKPAPPYSLASPAGAPFRWSRNGEASSAERPMPTPEAATQVAEAPEQASSAPQPAAPSSQLAQELERL
ncbi:MAG: hypothetical protein HY681_05820 [Chloroflexi bacterium]|nr:hypothetical protein [Chloroflexota bacterium]